MGGSLRAFLFTLIGKNEEVNEEEIKKAEKAGEMVARNAAKRMERMGIVEQVEIDAEAARQAAQAKSTVKEDAERTN